MENLLLIEKVSCLVQELKVIKMIHFYFLKIFLINWKAIL